MGDRFRKSQIENFRKRRERARRDASEPRLIERPEVTKTMYSIQADDGKECRIGENIRAVLHDADGPVIVLRGWEKIGIIDGEGGNVLKRALVESSSPSIAELRILSVSEISGEATAEMVGAANQ